MGSPAAELRKFYAPEFVFGSGARHLAGQHAANLGARHVLLVTDPGVAAAGWAADVEESLRGCGVATSVFAGVSPNPRSEEVHEGAERYRLDGCNAIVAVGGGSPMDCAKGIGAVAAGGVDIRTLEGVDEVALPGPPLVCVPTTAGTAADVSQFAIIRDVARGVKFAIVSRKMVPDVALIDPDTTGSMSRELAACTGLDALTHALEALASNASSPLTDVHACEAVRLIARHLERAVTDPGDLEARTGMMLASLEAGLAFSNASLGAVHAMAHSIGGVTDAPHGLCNAILLRHVVAFNLAARPDAYDRAAALLGAPIHGLTASERGTALLDALDHLRRASGVPATLGSVGVTRGAIGELAANALADACIVTNPRRPNRRDLEVLYEEAL